MQAKIWANILSGIIGAGIGLLECGLVYHNSELTTFAGITIVVGIAIRSIIGDESGE